MQPLYEYVCHIKGHRNSKGELAEWVIKSHETGKILSSHKSEQKAKEHLQQMHIFQEAADGSQAEDFHTLINRYATATASIINKFLEKYELSIEVVDTEDGKDFFEETGAIAVRLASLQDDVHVAPVAINEELISRYYYDEWDEDNTILNECVSDTLWHEACHHICLYISDTLDVDIMDNDSEEDIVENYALYMTSKTMGIHKEFSADLVDKFSGAFAILDAMNNGAFDKESLKEMMKFLDPSVDSENDLVDILEDIGLTESDSKSPVCAHCGWDGDGNLTEYNGRLLCPNCLKEFQRLDANRDANGYIKYDNITKRSDGFNPEGYKLIGESTDGTDMDIRVKIFMEGVSQLGLTSSQVDAIGQLTNACLESALTLPENFTDEDLASRDDLEERRLDQVYDELYKLGVPIDTINDRGKENDFSFNTMYQLLKDVCADKGIPVPEIDGAEDDPAKPSDADVYEALYPDAGLDYGRRVSTSEDDYDPDNPNDTDDDMFYDGNGRVNELDPDEESAEF